METGPGQLEMVQLCAFSTWRKIGYQNTHGRDENSVHAGHAVWFHYQKGTQADTAPAGLGAQLETRRFKSILLAFVLGD